MKIERGDVSVALSVVVALVVTVGGWLWYVRPNDDYYALFVEFDGVEGLSDQTPVRLQGFAVGQIQSIQPYSTETGSVLFRVELRVENRYLGDSGLSIPDGTVARVEYPPVVGSPYIVLEPPPEGGAALASGSEIPGMRAEALLDQLQLQAGQLTFQVGQTLRRATTLMDSVERVVVRLDRTIGTTESRVPQILDDLSTTIEAAQVLVTRVESEVDSTAPALRVAVDSATALIGESRRLLAQTGDLMEASEPRATRILASLDSTTYMLNHLVTRLAERPLRVFTGVGPPPPMPEVTADTVRDTVPGGG